MARRKESFQRNSQAPETSIIRPRRGRPKSQSITVQNPERTPETEVSNSAEQRGQTLRTSEWTPRLPPAALPPVSLPTQTSLTVDHGRGGSATTRKRGRRPNSSKNLDPPSGQRWIVEMNEKGQAVGKAAGILSSKLGMYAKLGNYFPINAKSWKKIPSKSLTDIWVLVENQYDFQEHPEAKNFVFSSLNRKWKDWKCELKRDHFDSHQTDEERIKDCHFRVDPHQWMDVVRYWGTPEGKAASERNKANRFGKKSDGHMEHEMQESQMIPSRTDAYHTTYNSQEPFNMHRDAAKTLNCEHQESHQSEASAAALGDAITQACGAEKPSLAYRLDFGCTRKDILSPAGCHEREMVTRLLEENWELREMNRRLEMDNRKMKKKMDCMDKQLKMVMEKLDIDASMSDNGDSSEIK